MAIEVEVTGWRRGFLSISFIKLIREVSTRKLGLSEAKTLVDEMVVGRPFSLQFENEDQADELLLAANKLGTVVTKK